MSDQQTPSSDAGPTPDQPGPAEAGTPSAPTVPVPPLPQPQQPPESAQPPLQQPQQAQPPLPAWPQGVPPGGYGQAPPAAYAQQWAPSAYGQVQQRPQASSNAIVALVLAIVAWVAVPVIPAIVALVLAHKATKEIEASNGWLTGSGMALAAKIISWINIAFFVLVGIFVAFIFVVVLASGSIEPTIVPTSDFGT